MAEQAQKQNGLMEPDIVQEETSPAEIAQLARRLGGETVVRTGTPYQTAITVQIPRNFVEVKRRCLNEAEIAGESFYYAWQVTDHRTGQKKMVRGPSIHLAMSAARNWMNTAIPIEVATINGEWVFRGTFIDLETGFNLQRVFRKRPTPAPGKYDQDRWDDMQFQAAQSRCHRNVVVKAVPSWLVDAMMAKAKESALKGIGKMGIEAARKRLLEFFKRYEVDQKILEKFTGFKMADWTADVLIDLRGVAMTIEDGQETVEKVFSEYMADKEDEQKQALADQFWKALDEKGVKRDDPDFDKYLQDIADFSGSKKETLIAESVEGMKADPKSVEKLVSAFRKRYPEKKEAEKTPQKGRQRAEGKSKGKGSDKEEKPEPAPDKAKSEEKTEEPGKVLIGSDDDLHQQINEGIKIVGHARAAQVLQEIAGPAFEPNRAVIEYTIEIGNKFLEALNREVNRSTQGGTLGKPQGPEQGTLL